MSRELFLILGFILAALILFMYFEGEVYDDQKNTPNVVIIDLDNMARYHMPCYGYSRNTTPKMCDFGEKNIMFENMVSQSGWTAGSVASLFSGQYPQVHRLTNSQQKLNNETITLAEFFRKNGYTTAAFPAVTDTDTEEPPTAYVSPYYNLDQGFQNFYGFEDGVGKEFYFTIDEKYDEIDYWLDKERNEPFFLYVQSFQPHRYGSGDWRLNPGSRYGKNYSGKLLETNMDSLSPDSITYEDGLYYIQKGDNKTRLKKSDINYVVDKYDNSIVQTDRNVGKFLNLLKEKEVYSNSIIIVMANHGASIDKRTLPHNLRFMHGGVWETDTHVPFMMHVPENISTRVSQQTEIVDLYPTLAEELELDINKGHQNMIQGRSFEDLYKKDNSTRSQEPAIITEHSTDRIAVRNKSWKLITFPGEDDKLYNIEEDPFEKNNSIREHPEIAESLEEYGELNMISSQMLRSDIYS